MINHNQIYLLGNLTRDPELKYTNEGVAIAEMGIAVNKRWKDSSGTENRAADFFNITVWNNLAENCSNSLKKGDRVIVGGHLNLRTWENREGKKFNIVNITADIVAVSLEFEKFQDKEKKAKKPANIESSKKGSGKGNSPDDEHVEVVEAIK